MNNVFDLPEQHPIRVAHKMSIRNRQQLEESVQAGCFYCVELFSAADVIEWTDTHNPVGSHTALCPKCGIDSVLGDLSGFPITPTFLLDMKKHWFE